jgi:hypothetical protein
MIIRELLTKWGIDVDDRELEALDRKIKVVKDRFEESGKEWIKYGKGLSLWVTTPLVGAAGAMVKFADDAESAQNRFNAVFRTIGPKGRATAKSLADSFGMSISSVQDLLAGQGRFLQSMNFSEAQAFDLGKTIVALSKDIAEFNGTEGGAETVIKAVNGALAGNAGALRKSIGTVIEENEVLAVTNQLRLEGVQGTEAQIKALATLRVIEQKNIKALGAYKKSAKELGPSIASLNELLKDTAATFGEILLPVVLFLINKVAKPTVRWFRDLGKAAKTFVLVMGGLAAAAGPLLISIGMLQKALVLVMGPMKIIAGFMTAARVAAMGMAAAWLAAFAIIFLIFEDLYAFATGKRSVAKFILEQFGAAIDGIGEKFKGLPEIVRVVMAAVLTPIRLVVNTIQALGGALGALSMGDFKGAYKAIKEQALQMLPNLNDMGSMIGFSSNERLRPAPTPAMAAATAGAGASFGEIKVENQISVPAGTPPQLVGNAVSDGVKRSMDEALRQTREVVKPQVEF